MRTAFLWLGGFLFVTACNTKTEEEKPPMVKAQTLVTLPISPEKVKGTYVGDFKGSPISIILNYVSDNHASGYDVHKGLTRNISGSIETKEDGLHLMLAEPGNNQYDGKFDIVIDTAKWSGKAKWTPMKKGEETTFSFKRQAALNEDEQYGSTYIDSVGNYIILKPDGSSTYSYLTDTTNTGQQLTIKGNYKKEKGSITIFWEKNEVFPSGKSIFKMIEVKPYKDDDYVEKSLKGEGKVFSQMYD